MGVLDDLTDGEKKCTIDDRTNTPLGDWARKYKWSYVRRDDRWADKFPRMMEFLLADERATELKWPFRFERGDLYTWEEWEPSLDMRVVMHKANFLIDILERVPEFVWKDQP